jgi:Zn-dependent protease
MIIGVVLQKGLLEALVNAATFAVIYTVVVMHELGHSAAAHYFGYKTERITLYMFGGIAKIPEIEEAAEIPFQEVVIALAGPLVNIFLAIVAFIIIGPAVVMTNLKEGADLPWYLMVLVVLISVNLLMAAYNLIPAFPLDGGRALRGLLGFFFAFNKASMMT